MATLLEKTRKINRLLQRSVSVEYDGIARVDGKEAACAEFLCAESQD